MNPSLSFFADENIPTDLINWIKSQGYIVSSVMEENLHGTSDINIIEKCLALKYIILTQDNDFGKMIFMNSIAFYSVIYLRPGHFDGRFHIPTLQSILKNKELIKEGTLIIGQRIDKKIKIRIKKIEVQ